jgi:hypothetical protein
MAGNITLSREREDKGSPLAKIMSQGRQESNIMQTDDSYCPHMIAHLLMPCLARCSAKEPTLVPMISRGNPLHAPVHVPVLNPDVHASRIPSLRCWIVSHNPLDLALVCCAVLAEEVVCVSLGWRVWVRIVQEILHSEKDLFDGDRWLPALFLIQDGQADCARGIDIRVEERGYEFA